MPIRNAGVLLILQFLCFFSASGFAPDPPGLKIIPNRNQWADDVQFSINLHGGWLNLQPGRFSYYFIDLDRLAEIHEDRYCMPDGPPAPMVNVHGVQVDFLGANTAAVAHPVGRSREYYNYFIGNDPSRWATRVHAFEAVIYQGVYDGIDMKIHSEGDNLKYDFVVSPGSDPSVVRIAYSGLNDLRLENGDLVATTSLGELREKHPLAWQNVDNRRVVVACEFQLDGNVLSFRFPNGYDPCYELVIDPLLIFSTYSGSTADNWGSTATPGERGNLYSAGATIELTGGKFPATSGVFQTSIGGVYDVGILKYDSTGTELLYASYLGGSGLETAHSLVMANNEDLLVLGTTGSENFPVTANAYDQSYNGGVSYFTIYNIDATSDIFVARISGDGTTLIGSSFFGGSHNDGVGIVGTALVMNYGDELRGDIITDQDGNIYVSSVTSSNDFPKVSSFGMTYAGGFTDAVLMKLTPDVSDIIWSACLGGGFSDAAYTLKLDAENNVYTAGGTMSGNFPVTPGAYQKTYSGDGDGWIAKVAADGSSILYATYVGTDGTDQVYFLDLDKNGEPYVYGLTDDGVSIPKVPAGQVYGINNGGQFVQKYSEDLSTVLLSTTFGSGRGVPDISPTAFLVNECGNLYLSGWAGSLLNNRVGGWPTSTFGLSVSEDAFQKTTTGNDFYFLVLTSDLSEFLYGTYLGGTSSRTHVDGGTSRFDKGGIVYHAVCSGCRNSVDGPSYSDFPTTMGVWSRTNNSYNCNNAAFKFDLSSLKARFRTNSSTFDNPGVQILCLPEMFAFENFSTGGQRYHWDFGDGNQIVTSSRDPIIHNYSTPGKYIVKLLAIDEGTCAVVDSTAMTVVVNNALSHVQDDDDVCEGSSYKLNASGGVQYVWSTDDGFFSGSASPAVTLRDTTAFYVTITEANGCVRRDTVTLNLVPSIEPKFSWERLPSCADRPYLHLVNETESTWASDYFFFDFGDGTTSDEPDVTHYFERDSVFKIRLVANREFCVYEKMVEVPVFEYLVPNVITPDGTPGQNDTFTVQFGRNAGVTPRDYGLKVSLRIYNRWGALVYESDDYQYDWRGEDLQAGVYFYEVVVEGHGSCRDWLHVVR